MQGLLTFLLSLLSGYTFFQYFTHPNKKKHIVPKVKYKNVEILPNVRIHFRKTTLHLHHWFIFTAVTISSLFILDGIFHLLPIKGMAIGGIIQGLRFKDRFKFRYPRINQMNEKNQKPL